MDNRNDGHLYARLICLLNVKPGCIIGKFKQHLSALCLYLLLIYLVNDHFIETVSVISQESCYHFQTNHMCHMCKELRHVHFENKVVSLYLVLF